MRLEDIIGVEYMNNKREELRKDMDEMVFGNTCSLADCETAPASKVNPWGCKTKKEEIPMSAYSSATIVTEGSIEKDQRRALSSALYTAFRVKVAAAKKQFGLTGDEYPETMTDFIARIVAGKFVIDTKYEDCFPSASYITWKDPSVVVDKAGYKAARAQLNADHNDLELKLMIIPVTDGLTAVEAYKAAA